METLWRKAQSVDSNLLRIFLVDPSSGQNLAYMDGIRAVAVLMVVVYHSWVISGPTPLLQSVPGSSSPVDTTPIVASGFLGVQLFFVLSGFLLAQTWLKADYAGKPRPSTKRYFTLRIARIVPAYYVCLFFLLLFFTPSFIPTVWVYSKLGLFMLAAHLLFLQYIFPVSSISYVIDGSLWTLTMEMIFYVVLPFLIVFFLRGRWMLAVVVSLAISLLWSYLCRYSLSPLVNLMMTGTPTRRSPNPRRATSSRCSFPPISSTSRWASVSPMSSSASKLCMVLAVSSVS